MTDLETILSWFQTGDMPTQEEFQETFSSFRHNSTKIPIAEVDGLQLSLNNKVNVGDIIGGGGDFVPLSGTESNKPLTGNIKIDNSKNYFSHLYTGDLQSSYTALSFESTNYVFLRGVKGSQYSSVSVSGITAFIESSNFPNGNARIQIAGDVITVSNTGTKPRGIRGSQDFSANIEALDYVQKKYVDDAIASLGGGNEGGVWTFPVSD